MIFKIQNQWYGILERQPTSTVAMMSSKQTNKLINHAQKFALIMIKPQHSRETTAMSRLTNQCVSWQQLQIDHILKEYQNIFQEPNGVPLHCQVKHSIELVPGSSLPNTCLQKIHSKKWRDLHTNPVFYRQGSYPSHILSLWKSSHLSSKEK